MMWRNGFRISVLGSIVICVLFTAPGCISLSTFNSPETTPNGSGSLGAGAVVFIEEDEEDGDNVGVLPEAYGRVGLSDRWDVGVKVSPFVFFSDVKYQVVDARVNVAADLGVSTGGLADEDALTFAAYPAVFVGTERFYAGGRLTFAGGTIELFDEDVTYSGTIPSVMVGASFGSKFRVMPEINLYLEEPRLLPALGIQYRIGDDG